MNIEKTQDSKLKQWLEDLETLIWEEFDTKIPKTSDFAQLKYVD